MGAYFSRAQTKFLAPAYPVYGTRAMGIKNEELNLTFLNHLCKE